MKAYLVVGAVNIASATRAAALLPAGGELLAILAAESWQDALSQAAALVRDTREVTVFEVADAKEQNIVCDRTPVITWAVRDNSGQQWRQEL